MAADTTMTIYGSWHLTGKTVGVSVAGIDMGDFFVATNGSVTVPYGSDPGGIITPSYLMSHVFQPSDHDVTFAVSDGTNSVSVTVPIVIGMRYTAQGQLLRPSLEAQLGAGPGPGQGKRRRGSIVSFLVKDMLALKVGTSFLHMDNALLTPDGGNSPGAMPTDVAYNGVFIQHYGDQWGFDSQLCWETDRAYPVVIAGASIFLEGSEK